MTTNLNEERKNKKGRNKQNPFLQSVTVAILKLTSKLPFWMIYGISDFFYFINKYFIKYRYKVTWSNLKHAFPDKSEEEIHTIREKFYRHLTDLFFEAIKMYGMTAEQMEKHITFEDFKLMEKYANEGQSLIALAFHHNNWEWCSFSQTKVRHKVLMVYNPLRNNPAMEKFVLNSREKWGGESVPVNQTARTAIRYMKENKLSILWLAADQTPPANSKLWTLFLNQETPFFSGPEKIAKRTNQPILFQHVRKVKRGQYKANFTLLVENPAELDEKEILLRYVQRMEEVIRQEPEYYLWSHRRWKHQRPEGTPLLK